MIGKVDAGFSLTLKGETVAGRFDWRAIDRLRSEFGEDAESIVISACNGNDVSRISTILEATTGRDASEWMEESLPVHPVANALVQAMELAYLGPERETQEGNQKGPRAIQFLGPILSRLRWASKASGA